MRAAIYTLGCKVNQFESQAMEQELLRRGFSIVPFDQEAEVYIVNSCTVTAMGDQKSRQALSRARKKHPNAIVVLCGCYAQVSKETDKLDADLIAGTGDRLLLLDQIETLLKERKKQIYRDNVWKRHAFERLPAGSVQGRVRALLKVQDGCANFCTYCIIPYARGPVRSLPIKEAIEEARRLEELGFQELVITGIEISSYGKDLPEKPALEDLIMQLCTCTPKLRIRLGSLEPRTITREFCDKLKDIRNLCPHFHLSLQSGCDETLRRMNRKYRTESYWESVQLLRETFPFCAITTDLIVGFPGETAEEWNQTMTFIRRCSFADMHIFPYSRRKGTPAAEMSNQLTRRQKQDRVAQASALAEQMRREYRKSLLGTCVEVLFEQEKEGKSWGHAPCYIPVQVPCMGLRGGVFPVRLISVSEEGVLGQLNRN